MTVKHEIKSQLAKLLATEDLMVEHKNVETAQFNFILVFYNFQIGTQVIVCMIHWLHMRLDMLCLHLM